MGAHNRDSQLFSSLKGNLWMMACILVWGVACFAFFQCCYKYHFFYQEQNQIFLFSDDYLRGYFLRPAWFACLTGDFLTQFYYYLYAGPALLTLALLTLGDLTRRALQRAGLAKGWAFAIAIIAMTVEAVCACDAEFRLSTVVALCGGLAAYIATSLVSRGRATGAIAITLASALTYWLFGYGLWALLLLAVLERLCRRRQQPFHWSDAFLLMPAVAAVVVAMTCSNVYYLKPGSALTYPGVGRLKAPDFILEQDFAVDNEYHFGNYRKVEQLVESAPAEKRTEEMLFFYNLVQARKGELPDKLLKFIPNQLGTFYAIGPNTPRITIINMNELYWALGDMTLTERAAMMTNVFAPNNRNVRMIKRLAECNLVSGDTLAANKYLRLLEKTWVYADWAKRMSRREPKVFHYILEKRKCANQADTIRLSDNLHLVMMQLLDSNPENTVALDYILCSNLLLKDITNFKRDYDRYCYDQGRERVKPLYQQALMIYLAGTNAPKEEWGKYIHDDNELQRFRAYNNERGNPKFSDTYWYYFDTAKVPQP